MRADPAPSNMTEALLWFLLAANLVAFLAMGFDKERAKRGGRRVPERTLLLLALPGAAPGAWAGMQTFRHKTVKGSFRRQMFLVTFLQVAVVYAWFRWL